MPGELQPLRFAPRERGHRLAELEVFQTDIDQWRHHRLHLRVVGKEGERFGYRQFEHIGDRQRLLAALACEHHLQHLGAKTPAVAVGAAQVHVGEELHLHVLEAVAAAGGAAARRSRFRSGVETERTRGIAALNCHGLAREQGTNGVEGADIARRVRARGPAYGRLIHHDHVIDQLRAFQRAVPAWRLGGAAFGFQQRRMQHVLDQRRFARTGDAGDADQARKRNRDIDVLQVVLGGAEQLQPRSLCLGRPGRHARVGALSSGKVFGSERALRLHFCGRAERHHLAAALARARPHVEQAVGGEHDLRIVLDHDQRVAGVAQPVHHLDYPAHVARVQADGGLVEYEQGIDQRSAERGGEVDTLHFAAGERARLAVESEIGEAHLAQVGKSRTDLGEQ